MSKETKKEIEIDLCPKKPDANLLSVGDTELTITMILKTTAALEAKHVTGCVKALETRLHSFQKQTQDYVNQLEAKIKVYKEKKNSRDAQAAAAAAGRYIGSLCNTMRVAMFRTLEDYIKREGRSDPNFAEAEAKILVDIGFDEIELDDELMSGGDEPGVKNEKIWLHLGRKLVVFSQDLEDACKQVTARLGELQRASEELTAAKNLALRTGAPETATKSQAAKAEECRKKYNDLLAGALPALDALARHADNLLKLVKSEKSLARIGIQLTFELDILRKRGLECVEQFFTDAKCDLDDMEAAITPDRVDALASLGNGQRHAAQVVLSAKKINEAVKKIMQ